jgi:hypothetical protein
MIQIKINQNQCNNFGEDVCRQQIRPCHPAMVSFTQNEQQHLRRDLQAQSNSELRLRERKIVTWHIR